MSNRLGLRTSGGPSALAEASTRMRYDTARLGGLPPALRGIASAAPVAIVLRTARRSGASPLLPAILHPPPGPGTPAAWNTQSRLAGPSAMQIARPGTFAYSPTLRTPTGQLPCRP